MWHKALLIGLIPKLIDEGISLVKTLFDDEPTNKPTYDNTKYTKEQKEKIRHWHSRWKAKSSAYNFNSFEEFTQYVNKKFNTNKSKSSIWRIINAGSKQG
jgi:hypothetical protein